MVINRRAILNRLEKLGIGAYRFFTGTMERSWLSHALFGVFYVGLFGLILGRPAWGVTWTGGAFFHKEGNELGIARYSSEDGVTYRKIVDAIGDFLSGLGGAGLAYAAFWFFNIPTIWEMIF